MCVDYCQQLNLKMQRDAYPLPQIESLDVAGGAKHFSTIDLVSAYNQVMLTLEIDTKLNAMWPG